MSDEDRVDVHVLVVSASQGRDDLAGPAVADALVAAGHGIADRLVVSPNVEELRLAVHTLASGHAQALVIVGGTTLFEEVVSQRALAPILATRFEGFSVLARHLAHGLVGSQALWLESFAGLVGKVPVFALPPSAEVGARLIEELVAPQLQAAVGLGFATGEALLPPSGPVDAAEAYSELSPDPVTQDAIFDEVHPTPEEGAVLPEEEEALPEPTGTLGRLGRGGLSFSIEGTADATAPPPQTNALPGAGWVRAVHEIGGTVHYDKREEMPQPVEAFAPLLDVLHQAGETAVLSLPSGVKYSVWGYPDLRRPTSKVLALGWGKPLCELLALHRYPVQTGTCVEGAHGLLPRATSSVAEICEAITGRVPDDAEGTLFAVEGEAVYILRGNQVVRFDGRREQIQGTPKQALATLSLAWSQK